jgi:2-polyprenyl-6-methoxyphenol hydroxylase-like FAD-dependent oxidoreductase
LAGDGGHSTVRKALGLSLRGQTPDVQLMAVGDVEVDGLGRDAWHQWFSSDGAIMLCPLPGTSAFQVQASHELDQDGSPLEPTLERFQRTFDRVAGLPGVRLRNLTWRSSYRVNVRMVDQLQADRVFLAGDAAHVHPIAGGLGMNSGIQDAYNLGWKLGLVLAGHANPGLLGTYEEERLPIASALGPQLARHAKNAEDAGITRVTVMDHFWQIGPVGPVEHEMLERRSRSVSNGWRRPSRSASRCGRTPMALTTVSTITWPAR